MPTRFPQHSDKTVLILYTGGTIGMREGPHGLAPAGDFAARLDRMLATLPAERRRALPDIEVISYATPVDSSSVTPLDWQTLADDIRPRCARHAGIVVVHGTDTLSWTSASLSLQLRRPGCPVIVTGAMAPLEAPNSDALENLEGALRFAALPPPVRLDDVAIYFAGRLLRGSRATKWHASAADAFTSPGTPPLGDYHDGPRLLAESAVAAHEPDATTRALLDRTPTNYRRINQGEIVRIVLWPGMAAWQLSAWLEDSRVEGALLQLWGAGNIADDPALIEVLERAVAQGKLIVAVSQCLYGSVSPGTYAAGHALARAGVLPGGDMPPEAAFAKLAHLVAMPLDSATRRQAFITPWVGESGAD
ncbi:asparaginase [Vreelandella jeotgali]|uniref:asparaginase n=1 Tax=Vreelandella jeotgali TaxID=553386 RepID=UPI000348B210|nr:asparaginase [Halomonas jeotgali]